MILQQCTILQQGQHGFVFDSNRGSRVTMTAENATIQFDNQPKNPFSGDAKKFKSKQDILEEKVAIF